MTRFKNDKMKKILPLVVLMMFVFSNVAFAIESTVVYYNKVTKNTVLISYNNYFCGKLEWVDSGFEELYEGDKLEGLVGCGKRYLKDLTNDREVGIFISKTNLTKDSAKEWVREQEKNGIW
ncbi:hypothetical protein NZ47_13230 [Anaerovibrio lipolyticus]|jgi:hypothetical protein|uniref:Uncharacterized protein n=1 Tax=Anaerovibrio lipolyticus TaxID=82374 RepID=A0A0B2JJ54_9FIRM|nr:hypothetical protein [Anaerovibrio lipolyticus]KHM48460.1 hypothetical protein NZ47_13230 [Anaerovibrio lipolyticus]